MIYKRAEINDTGINTLLRLKTEDTDHIRRYARQQYLPGITVPDHEGLTEPFSVPISGGNEPFNIVVEQTGSDLDQDMVRVVFTEILPAESAIPGSYQAEPRFGLDDLSFALDTNDPELTAGYEQLKGEWGGVLRAAAIGTAARRGKHTVPPTGDAQFILFESEQEYYAARQAVADGTFTT